MHVLLYRLCRLPQPRLLVGIPIDKFTSEFTLDIESKRTPNSLFPLSLSTKKSPQQTALLMIWIMTRSIHCNSQLINSIHLGSGLKCSILFYFEPSQLQFSQMLWKGHFKVELMSPLVKMAYKENRHFHVRCFLPRIESFQPHFMKYLWNGSKKMKKNETNKTIFRKMHYIFRMMWIPSFAHRLKNRKILEFIEWIYQWNELKKSIYKVL